jgi:redox-sensing transcriptional repressor
LPTFSPCAKLSPGEGDPVIKDPAISRLTELLSLLPQLEEEEENLNSRVIGRYLDTTADSVRKDISRLERSGKRGAYDPEDLIEDIREKLNLEQPIPVCLAGLGPLGVHLMELLHDSDETELIAAFDGRMNRIERLDAPVDLFPSWELEEMVQRKEIILGVISTAPEEAEKTAARMTAGGIRAILNFSGYYLPHDPAGPVIKNVNFGASLLELICRLGDK